MYIDEIKLNKKERKGMVTRMRWGREHKKYVPTFSLDTFLQTPGFI